MKILKRSELPSDYKYYRSHAGSFAEWMGGGNKRIQRIDLPDGSFGWICHFFSGAFSLARFEKVDTEPTLELLSAYGMKRGIVSWSSWKREERPANWRRFFKIFSLDHYHSRRSAFSVLDSDAYEKKWATTAQRKRRHIRKMIADGTIAIHTKADPKEFLQVYEDTKISHSHKNFLLKRQKFFYENSPENIRTYLAYVNGEALAGATFLDDYPTSIYLVGFQDKRAKDFHLGLALMDAWFEDSRKKDFHYLDLDHMRDSGESRSFRGYTHFKSRIADYELRFSEVWFRWIRK